jgi:hypothetical protein
MRKLVALLVAVVAITAASAAPIGFSGDYAPGNWTLTNTPVGTAGSVDASGAPHSVIITSGNAGIGGTTDFTITMPVSGVVSFCWFFESVEDDPENDPFGYTVNGVFTVLTKPFDSLQNGSVTLFLNQGDVFGFRAATTDGEFGPSLTTICNFNVSVPEPVSLVVFGGLVAGGAGVALRRRRSKATA